MNPLVIEYLFLAIEQEVLSLAVDLGNSVDLDQLILKSEKFPNSWIKVNAAGNDSSGFPKYSSISSTYKDTHSSRFPTNTSFMVSRVLILAARGSMARANRRGDREHPHLVPLPILKVCVYSL